MDKSHSYKRKRHAEKADTNTERQNYSKHNGLNLKIRDKTERL